jgi:hypothetical protein
VSLLAIAFGVSGCGVARFDIPTYENQPTVASIVSRIRCELLSLLADDQTRPKLLAFHYVVGVQLSLTVTNNGELAPTFDIPALTDEFSFNVGFKLGRQREQNFTQNLYFSMDQLDRDWKRSRELVPGKENKFADCPDWDTNLSGKLGIDQMVKLAFTSPPYSDPNAELKGTAGEFGGYVDFVVTKNINGTGPTWKLVHLEGPGKMALLSRVNHDKISFGFAPSKGEPEVEAGTKVSPRVRDFLLQLGISQIQQTNIRE